MFCDKSGSGCLRTLDVGERKDELEVERKRGVSGRRGGRGNGRGGEGEGKGEGEGEGGREVGM
jgi:hypothetical protein